MLDLSRETLQWLLCISVSINTFFLGGYIGSKIRSRKARIKGVDS